MLNSLRARENQRKDNTIQIRISTHDKDIIRAELHREGISYTEFIEKAIMHLWYYECNDNLFRLDIWKEGDE